ncbi:PLP-dependent aminotransferase family protein [Colwellia sp. E2M01]|uniref:aminotransferase-like domain-containing protein n=1 Tax=Colwellia sp. E2M01 TaxID=2841561 RepID=UPI001C0893D6|nr:PLP-dependent aminotransferase family protein [Colwellia sp. E2M01]MBU2872334.1 PLP-dependent aminotransferase family protein [Colwellia sp. E2M01]
MKLAKSLQEIQPSYIREILDAASAPGVISLAGGLPDAATFPLPLMAKSLTDLPNRTQLFQYGNTAGYTPLLEHFRTYYQLPASHDSIICTGSQQGLDLIARSFINPGDNIVMEAPSYLGAIQVFGLVQANIESISQRADGPDLEQLEACFATKDITLFYAVPDFHNPTGVCWSLQVRQKVAQLCQQYNVAFIEDVPYRELRFKGEFLPLVSSFCPDNSLVLRSFSKIATPGIRLGLVTGRSDWVAPLNKVKQAADLHSSIPMQAVLLDLLQHDGFEQHLEVLRGLYSERYQALLDNIALKLPAACTLNPVNGGMFIWLSLPDCDVDALAQTALEHGVAVVPSSVFYQQRENVKPALRLNFTNANAEQLSEAIDRLTKVINIHCK